MADSSSQVQTIRLEYIAAKATADAVKFANEEQARTKASADVAKKAARDVAEANKAAVKEQSDADKKRAADSKSLDADMLAMKRESMREAARKVHEFNQSAAASEKKHEEAVKRQAAAWESQTQSIVGGVKQVGMFALSMAGLSSASAIVNALAEKFDLVRVQTFEAAKEVMGFRMEILELAALKDNLGNTTPALVAQLKLRGQTLQSAPEANKMELAARGIGEAAIGRTVSAADFEALLISTGKLQAMEHSDAGAYGELAGTLALQAKPGATGEDLKGKLQKLYEIQRPGGFTSVAQFAKQYAQISPFVQSGIYSQEEAAAMLSGLSLTGPETAATRLEQATRGASSGLMRARGMKMPAGMEHETSAAYFASLGITEGESPRSRLEKIAADINKQKALADAAGKPFLADEYLIKHGSTVSEANDAYIEMAGLIKSGAWAGKFVPLINAVPKPGEIDATHAARIGREPTLLQRQAELAGAASVMTSAGTASGDLAMLQQAAFGRAKSNGEVKGTFDEWKKRGVLGRMFDDSLVGTGHQAVDFEAQQMLVNEANRLGIAARVPTRTDARSGLTTTEYMGDEALFGLQRQVQQSGGNPLADVAKDIKRAADALETAAAAIAGPGAAKPGVAAVPPALPGPQPGPRRGP